MWRSGAGQDEVAGTDELTDSVESGREAQPGLCAAPAARSARADSEGCLGCRLGQSGPQPVARFNSTDPSFWHRGVLFAMSLARIRGPPFGRVGFPR